MTEQVDIQKWPKKVGERYENYLKTSFFFKDPKLRKSFEVALQKEGNLLKGPFPEEDKGFATGTNARTLADECFGEHSKDIHPALIDRPLYVHQQGAIESAYASKKNIVVATGTASGKTECFLYPILFELYKQHLSGTLEKPGVRAMILYPMNALANDQRTRLGKICSDLTGAGSSFKPTFGQYIGQTPYDAEDHSRNAQTRMDDRLPGELVFRDEMRENPPHVLLTNYSMLEYLLIRPDDSPLFDQGAGTHWQFIVLDEAHQYRGAKGMEMGMLLRRLKQRIRDGGRTGEFLCIGTSATISSEQGEDSKRTVAEFSEELFGERFSLDSIIFGDDEPKKGRPRRYHAFLRALEGAFLVHDEAGADTVVLNRKDEMGKALEIALCGDCGQHYYVGRNRNGKLEEAVRDPSQDDFGVEYYLPAKDGQKHLCRRCGAISDSQPNCDCGATIRIKKCDSHHEHADRLKKCEACGYQRRGIGDPVQEIVHGSDGPNTVIATALHELLPENHRKVLAFADSRQEAAFFAWYAEDSYSKVRDRNFILRAINADEVDADGLSIDDLRNRLQRVWEESGLLTDADTGEKKKRKVLKSILREALTPETRLSLSGVGLVKWWVEIPQAWDVPEVMAETPWNFTNDEARRLVAYLLDELRRRRAMALPSGSEVPVWDEVSPYPQQSVCRAKRRGRQSVFQWASEQSSIVKHFLYRILASQRLSDEDRRIKSVALLNGIWDGLEKSGKNTLLARHSKNGEFRLDPRWLRVRPVKDDGIWRCDTCTGMSTINIRGICTRNRCPGMLKPADKEHLKANHYRILYESSRLPPELVAQEHTAQIDSEKARMRQDEFKRGNIHLLSSSTTFEVGVDLGDLETVLLRNVPPEPFNYTQRVGRAGRRDTPGLALTYCRRNPHDLYHYEDPESRVVRGMVKAPRLRMTNEKIILRHMVAVALAAFFRKEKERFVCVSNFVAEWANPRASADLKEFCEGNIDLSDSLRHIVPENMHGRLGLKDGEWVNKVAGQQSRLAAVEAEVCADYRYMEELIEQRIKERNFSRLKRIQFRMDTIAKEKALNFLSRKAAIPKYGFPVDVVELETGRDDEKTRSINLQRDMSLAIAEYAPGSKVVANKWEWEPCGVKRVAGKAWPVRYYRYDDARNFEQWDESQETETLNKRKYLIPEFGFVTPMFTQPKEPRGRTGRLYTTRPFFQGFSGQGAGPHTMEMLGARVTKATSGTLVILCEGRKKKGFYICRRCGSHGTQAVAQHKSPSGTTCDGTLEWFSLGHELVTDVVRLQFPGLCGEWDAYSVAYAVLLGAAEALEVPESDLNVTITCGDNPNESAIVLYDNVPGGAGLVVQLESEKTFQEVLSFANMRVQGNCGCDSSCYGCLRSYRNQFAHPHLDRKRVMNILNATG